MFKKFFLILFFLLSFFSISFSGNDFLVKENINEEKVEKRVYLNVFEREDCIHCINQFKFLDSLENKNFYINKINVNDSENNKIFKEIAEKYGISASTPLNLIGDSIIVGFDSPESTGKQILEKIKEAEKEGKFNLGLEYYLGDSKMEVSQGGSTCSLEGETAGCSIDWEDNGFEQPQIEVERKESITFLGYTLPIKEMSLFTLSSVLGFIDGFNPCAMWVLLTFLIALSQVGDRRKMAMVAGLFILAQAIMYYFILVFWSSAWKIMPNKDLVTYFIGILAIAAGLFFLYKWWKNRKKFVCDTQGAEKQHLITEKITKLSKKPMTFLTALSILAIAFSVNVIEVACSLGIPQTFTMTLSINELSFWMEQFYIFVYTFFYMIDDIIVFSLALWGYKKFYQIGAKYSKISTLLAGILILILGILLAFFPTALIF